jgi:hypothetical protein
VCLNHRIPPFLASFCACLCHLISIFFTSASIRLLSLFMFLCLSQLPYHCLLYLCVSQLPNLSFFFGFYICLNHIIFSTFVSQSPYLSLFPTLSTSVSIAFHIVLMFLCMFQSPYRCLFCSCKPKSPHPSLSLVSVCLNRRSFMCLIIDMFLSRFEVSRLFP